MRCLTRIVQYTEVGDQSQVLSNKPEFETNFRKENTLFFELLEFSENAVPGRSKEVFVDTKNSFDPSSRLDTVRTQTDTTANNLPF